MAFRKNIQTNQKSKSKIMSLPKCFHLSGITKSLFPCKSTHNQHTDNYVVMDFDNKTNSTQFSTAPTSSTMIDTQNFTQDSINRLYSSGIPKQNEYYVLQPDSDTRQIYFNGGYVDMEETRRSTMSISSITSYFTDNEDITIVPQDKSPISQTKTSQSDESFNEYFHSTKLSNENLNILSSSTMSECFSPIPYNKQSTVLHSPISNSINNSQSNSTSNYLEITSQLESLILGLSSIQNDANDTHVCTQTYEATFVDDISVNFADTLKIIRDNNDDWLFVKISSDGRKGFVPKSIVIDLKDFIDQLKDHHSHISRATMISTDI